MRRWALSVVPHKWCARSSSAFSTQARQLKIGRTLTRSNRSFNLPHEYIGDLDRPPH